MRFTTAAFQFFSDPHLCNAHTRADDYYRDGLVEALSRYLSDETVAGKHLPLVYPAFTPSARRSWANGSTKRSLSSLAWEMNTRGAASPLTTSVCLLPTSLFWPTVM